MAKFHRYSARNTLMIYMQNPTATVCAGFEKWKEFGRHVRRGEKGITILAPISLNITQETEKLDDDTKMPLYDSDGNPIIEEVEVNLTKFKPVTVFDILQTDGEPLATLVEDLPGNVRNYDVFMEALRQISPLPIEFEQMQQDGYCRYGEKIGIRDDMSEIQTICAVIHEISHAKIYNVKGGDEKPKDKRAQECACESISYVICQYYGIETDKNSLSYIASWSRDKDLKELKSSLETIRRTASELIDNIDEKFRQIAVERGIDMTAEIENAPETVEDSKVTPTADITTTMPIIPVEMRPVGTNVLMPPLFDDMLLNRDGKKIRVTVEEPIGKYPIYSHEENGEKVLYFLTASGRITHIWDYFANEWDDQLHKYVSVRPTEAEFDETMRHVSERFEHNMADRKRYVLYQDAAVLNRLDDCEAHNQPIRELHKLEREKKAQDRAEHEKTVQKERDDNFNKTVDELAEKIIRSEKATVEIDSYKNKNPLFSLFERYEIDLPLATKGWINRNLRAFQFAGGGRLSVWGTKGFKVSDTFTSSLWKLKAAIEQYAKTVEIPNLMSEKPETVTPQTAAVDYPLPDPATTIAERDSYGYTNNDILPMKKATTIELFDRDHSIYLLFADNTEAMAFNRDEILRHDGLFGVSRDEWLSSRLQTVNQTDVNSQLTVAEPESDVKAGKSILLTDLAKAAHSEMRESAPTTHNGGKPSLLGQLDKNKKIVEQRKISQKSLHKEI